MATMAEKISDEKILQRNNSIEQRSFSELRKVVSQNLREREQCKSRTNAIDRERRSLRAQLTREEEELRAQLGRLQLEKQALDEFGTFEGNPLDSDETYCDNVIYHEEEVTNPYPVTLGRPRQPGTMSRDGSTGRGTRRQRKTSSSQESQESYTKMLPPLQSSSSHSLVLSKPDITSARTASARDRPSRDEEDQCWIGEPEAISSVRRPRKTIAQQRSESHVWKRSRSLKENARPKTRSETVVSIGRSQSLRDGRCGGRTPVWSSTLSRTESLCSNLSRSPSFQDTELQLSVECLTIDAATEAELNRGPVHRCLRRHLGGSSSSFSKHIHTVLGSSPDTKSTVWGWIKDVDPSSEPECTPKTHESEVAETRAEASAIRPESDDKMKRKSSAKRRLRPLGDIKMPQESVGFMGNMPLIPSPSHLSVEKCYELLASTPVGLTKMPPNAANTKLEPIGASSDKLSTH